MDEITCEQCGRMFGSGKSLEQHKNDRHTTVGQAKKPKGQKVEKQESVRKFKLPSASVYVAIAISIVVVVAFSFIFSQQPSPTAKVTAQPVKQTESQNFPVKILGNYYKYSSKSSLSDGKVRVLFVGAEFCPFCAAERWSIVEALGRFGTFSGLKETTSASFNEPFLDLPTYNFMSANYDGSYVRFDHKETGDRNFRTLERLTSEEQTLFNAYNPRGSIPFLYIAGQRGVFVQVGSGYSPGTIQGLAFSSIQNDLKNNVNNKVAQSIMTEANAITALICYNNDNKPTNACNDPEVANLILKIR